MKIKRIHIKLEEAEEYILEKYFNYTLDKFEPIIKNIAFEKYEFIVMLKPFDIYERSLIAKVILNGKFYTSRNIRFKNIDSLFNVYDLICEEENIELLYRFDFNIIFYNNFSYIDKNFLDTNRQTLKNIIRFNNPDNTRELIEILLSMVYECYYFGGIEYKNTVLEKLHFYGKDIKYLLRQYGTNTPEYSFFSYVDEFLSYKTSPQRKKFMSFLTIAQRASSCYESLKAKEVCI